ncbi:MAG: hypothetical protein K8S54_09905 [Spirochaetia bacterium]|nr:hypothetical protein [Spirochaetia bacterium]
MNKLISLMFVCVLGCSSAQTEGDKPAADRKYSIACPEAIVTKVDSKGKPGERGKVELGTLTCDAAAKLDDKGLIKLKRSGSWTVFADGIKARTEEYAGGKKEGQEIGFFPDGSTRYNGQNSDDKKTGHWRIKAGLNSDCYTEGDYVQDLKSGKWTECSQGEKGYYTSFEGSYVSGLRDGPGLFTYEDGKKSAEGNYRADISCRTSLKPGAKKEDIEACGKRSGRWTYYYPNGQKSSEGECDTATGLESGTWRDYYQSGEKMGMGPRSGDRTGQWTFWGKDGAILYQLEFGGNDFLPKGGVLWKGGVKTGQGPFSMGMFKVDQKKDEAQVTSLIKDGAWIEYYPSGQKSAEGKYTSNRKDGKWIFYDESGRKTAEGPFMMDKKDGDWTELENGNYVKKKYQFGKPARF